MVQCRVQDHEADHLDDVRHLDEDERRVLYRLAHRWRLEHEAAARSAIPVRRIYALKIVANS